MSEIIDLSTLKEDIEQIKRAMRMIKELDIRYYELHLLMINRYGLTWSSAKIHIDSMERISGIQLRRD